MDKVATRSYNPRMRAVGIRVLKNKLSEYVKLAAAGEVILVTDRDTVVAELRAPGEGRSEVLADAKLAELVRNGLLTPALVPGSAPARGEAVMSLEELLVGLDEDRQDRDLP